MAGQGKMTCEGKGVPMRRGQNGGGGVEDLKVNHVTSRTSPSIFTFIFAFCWSLGLKVR